MAIVYAKFEVNITSRDGWTKLQLDELRRCLDLATRAYTTPEYDGDVEVELTETAGDSTTQAQIDGGE
jgi:hypothetical protein